MLRQENPNLLCNVLFFYTQEELLKGIVQRKLIGVELYIIQIVFLKLVIASFQNASYAIVSLKLAKKVFVLSNTNNLALSGQFINTLSIFSSLYSKSNICILECFINLNHKLLRGL
jgi:hypothetical protein